MEERDFVAVGERVLRGDGEARRLLCQGLEAHAHLIEALEALRCPEVFLEGDFELARWERALHQSVERFGVVFFAACQRFLDEQARGGEQAEGLEVVAEGQRGVSLGQGAVSDVGAAHGGALSARTMARIEALEDQEAEQWRRWAQQQVVEVKVPQEASAERAGVEGGAGADGSVWAEDGLVSVVGAEQEGKGGDEQEGEQGTERESEQENGEQDVVGGVEVTEDVVARLQASMSAKPWTPEVAASRRAVDDVGEVHREILVRGRDLVEGFEQGRGGDLMLACLNEASSEQFLGLCGQTSTRLQGVYVEFVAAQARHFQERWPLLASGADHVFARLLRFKDSGAHGFLYGLGRGHEARHGSWRQDAWRLWRRLQALIDSGGDGLTPGAAQRQVELLLDECDDPQRRRERLVELLDLGMQPDTRVLRLLACVVDELGGRPLRGLRRKVRAQMEVDEAAERSSQGDDWAMPSDWPFWHITQGRPAVLIGSAGKKFQTERIERAFGFSSLEWVDSCRSLRRVQALAQSIREGDERVFIIMHRYTSHSASDMIWAHRDHATVIGVNQGFGVHAVQKAIEHHCR